MRYKLLKQSSEEDCGAACVASIAKYYRVNFAINRIPEDRVRGWRAAGSHKAITRPSSKRLP